jgi:putative drug exporter of the RND superfamily
MLEKVARWSYRHRWAMLGMWIVSLIAFLTLSSTLGGSYSSDFSLPGTESQEAYDLLQERFGERAGLSADIVFKADERVDDPEVASAMTDLFDRYGQIDQVAAVESPYDAGFERNIAPEGTIAFGTVLFEDTENEALPRATTDEILSLANETEGEVEGLQIEPGGNAIQFNEFEEPGGTEMIGIVAAMFILLIAFGSFIAMGLPILSAILGIGIGIAIVFLSANFLNVPEFTPQLAMMIGIGVGIDYALLIVTRFRQHLHAGDDPETAVVIALTTAGRSVLFAGTIVVISFLGILLMGFSFVEGVAVGGAASVFVTMVASLTLLPAMMGFAGKSIDRWSLPRFHALDENDETRLAYRWSRVIQRRPAIAAIAGGLAVIVLAIPLFSIRLGQADAGTGDPTKSSRRAYDLLSEGFGPGFNGPLILAVELDSPEQLGELEELTAELERVQGVAAATPPIPSPDQDAAILQVYPTTSPQDPATNRLVHALRDDVIPQATADSDLRVLIGGATASTIDFSEKNSERLPILMAVVIALSFLLLMVVFRSVVVPVKAAIMNLLSIGAAYGVVVAVFQWGWLKDLFGVDSTAPIEAWVPMMLFTILFGLSMDYEIFLLSRVREEYVRTGDNARAVANGLAATARVITAAALIMITIFLSFVFFLDERSIKLFGLGLAVAIGIDASLIRMVLVPATMELLGNANWWLPKWLDRLIPHVKVEVDEVAVFDESVVADLRDDEVKEPVTR